MDEDDASDATQAFFQLTSEVALLRRAIEGLSALGDGNEAPDYSPTLGKMAAQLDVLGQQGFLLANSPLLRLTPASLAAQVEAVTSRARQDAKADWTQAQRQLDDAVRDLAKVVTHPRGARDQRRWIIGAVVAGVIGGMGLWTTFSGPTARVLPARWQVAERLAAATLNEDRWTAGARLMRQADPGAWARIVRGSDLERRNRVALDACEKAAARKAKPLSCEIKVGP